MRMFTYALQLPFCVGMLFSAVACAGENSPTPSFIKHVEQAKSHGFESVVMYYKNITEEDVQLIHEAGLEAGAWTVNGRSDMKRLLGLGIDRIYTDYPNVLREELCSQKGQE